MMALYTDEWFDDALRPDGAGAYNTAWSLEAGTSRLLVSYIARSGGPFSTPL